MKIYYWNYKNKEKNNRNKIYFMIWTKQITLKSTQLNPLNQNNKKTLIKHYNNKK